MGLFCQSCNSGRHVINVATITIGRIARQNRVIKHSAGGQFIPHVAALRTATTLAKVIPAIEALVGNVLDRIIADAGYRGHNAPPGYKLEVYTAGQKRRVTEQIKPDFKRRSVIEAVIGHLKDGHRMGRTLPIPPAMPSTLQLPLPPFTDDYLRWRPACRKASRPARHRAAKHRGLVAAVPNHPIPMGGWQPIIRNGLTIIVPTLSLANPADTLRFVDYRHPIRRLGS